jgi:hypothetical protein
MIRNLKVLGLALVAVFAMSAMVAASAQAVAAKFKADSTTASAKFKIEQDGNTATGTQVFVTEFGEVDCQTLTGSGTAANEAAEVTVQNVAYTGHQFLPESTACEAFGLEATINFNGCDYVFHAGTSIAAGESTGTADVVCPAGKSIDINAAGLCTVTVPAQTGLTHIIFHTVNPGGGAVSYVTATATVSNITYSGEGLLCSGHFGNGTYSGNAIATAFNDNVAEAAVSATILP